MRTRTATTLYRRPEKKLKKEVGERGRAPIKNGVHVSSVLVSMPGHALAIIMTNRSASASRLVDFGLLLLPAPQQVPAGAEPGRGNAAVGGAAAAVCSDTNWCRVAFSKQQQQQLSAETTAASYRAPGTELLRGGDGTAAAAAETKPSSMIATAT